MWCEFQDHTHQLLVTSSRSYWKILGIRKVISLKFYPGSSPTIFGEDLGQPPLFLPCYPHWPVCRVWQFSTRSRVCKSRFLLFYPTVLLLILGVQVPYSTVWPTDLQTDILEQIWGNHILTSGGWTAEFTVCLLILVPVRFEPTTSWSWDEHIDYSATTPAWFPFLFFQLL